MDKQLTILTESVLYCDKENLLDDDLGRSIRRIYRHGVCDNTIAGMIIARAKKDKFEKMQRNNPFMEAKLPKGDYVIGLDSGGNKLFSSIQYINTHCLTVAGSGAGKTTYSRFKLLQIAPKVRGLWLFDMQKKEFRILKSYLKRLGIELIILPVRLMRINPLQLPKEVSLADWIPRVSDMLVESLDLPPRASKLLQVELFKLFGRFAGKNNEYPTLFDLFESLRNSKDSNYQARVAILDNLEPVLLSLGAEVLGYRYGWSTNDLASHHIVFEFAGCSEIDKTLILNTLVLSEFISRIAMGVSNKKMDLMIFVDEAQRLCSNLAIMNLIGLIRGTGIGLDLSLQSTSGILPQIVSNTATKVLGRCGSFTDYNSAGSDMGLNSEMIKWAQLNLKPGTFIGQIGEGKWRHPFIFYVPKMNLATGIDYDDQEDNPLSKLKVIAADGFKNSSECVEFISSKNLGLFDNKQQYLFCKAVVGSPMKPSSEYPKLAGISPNKAKEVRQRLCAMNYIKEHTLETGSKGRSTILLEPLPDGISAVLKYEGKL